MRRGIFRPRAAEDVEWIRRGAADAVIRRAHDEFRSRCDLTELADPKMIAELRVVEQHIVPLKSRRVDRVVVPYNLASASVDPDQWNPKEKSYILRLN